MTDIKLKRVYEPEENDDGYRVLVDRLWPRGVSKERADLNLWAKDIAPSTQLREEFGHVDSRFAEFAADYIHELMANPDFPAFYDTISEQPGRVTLLCGARDENDNNAVVLKEYIQKYAQSAK